MSDFVAEDYKKGIQIEFDRTVTPLQRKAIENLRSYGSVESALGSKALPYLESFSAPEVFSSKRIARAAQYLKLMTGDGSISEVREFEQDEKRFLARRVGDGVKNYMLEVFRVPEGKLDVSWLTYENLVVVGEAGAVDLIELSRVNNEPDQTKLSMKPLKYAGVSKAGKGKSISEIDLSHGDRSPSIVLHEIGHGYQFDADYSPVVIRAARDLFLGFADFVGHFRDSAKNTKFQLNRRQEERNAAAFFLSVVRKCRQLGVDIYPDLSNSDIINIAEDALKSYDTEPPDVPSSFSKKHD